MAQAKKREEVIENEETQAELEEVRQEQMSPDLPGEAPQASSLSAEEVKEAAKADGVEVDEEVSDEDAEDDDERKTTKAGKRSAKSQREADEEAARQAAKESRSEIEEAPKAPRRSVPNPLHLHGKKYREMAKLVDRFKAYGLDEALELVSKTSPTKFDASVELHINLGVDPRQADQMVRSSVILPAGTGKTIRIAVFTDKVDEAKAAGADLAGTDDLLKDIEAGKLDFDLLIATPDKMATLGRVAKVLGPRGLMPNPKSGTVTPDVAKAVKDAKAGKVEFRIDKYAIVHQVVGKVSFATDDLRRNVVTLLDAILKSKPSAAKGTYVKAITISTTMGPGIKLDSSATISDVATKK